MFHGLSAAIRDFLIFWGATINADGGNFYLVLQGKIVKPLC